MRIVADTTRCVGAGRCVLTEPTVFDQDAEEGTVRLLSDRADGATLARLREAVDLCPGQALRLSALDTSAATRQ